MNFTLFRSATAFALAVAAGTALAGPLEEGQDAYQEKDYVRAVELWRPLAQAGDREAQYRLGVMYAEGKGIGANDAEAALWFERAAEQGEAMAQYNLGASYVEGAGVRKDMAAAAKWFRRAAEQGVPLAQPPPSVALRRNEISAGPPKTLADYLASGYRLLGFDFAKPTNSGVTMIAKGSDLRLCFIEPKTFGIRPIQSSP